MTGPPVNDPEGQNGRSKLAHISAPAVGVVVLAIVNWVTGASPRGGVLALAVIVGLLALAYLVRTEIHVEHLVRIRSTRPLHILVVALEVIVTLCFLAAPVFLFKMPGRLAELIVAGGLALAVVVLGLAMSWVAARYKIKTGTQLASHCWFVRGLRGLIGYFDHFPFFAWLNDLWERVAPTGKVSYLAVWITAALLGVAAANGAPLLKHLGDNPPPIAQQQKAKEQSRKSKPAPTPAPAPVPEPSPPPPEEGEASLSDLCGELSHPGRPAPEPAYGLLYAQWFGPGVGLGAIIAGCPEPAHELSTGVWYEAGSCHGAPRAMAVAAPGAEAGAILLWRPARFALGAAERGTLENASSSRLADEGELYTVTTVSGTYVFMRERVSDGSGELEGEARDCDEIKEDPVPFVMLPAALSRLWFEYVLNEETWIWPVTESTISGHTDFTFHSTDPADHREVRATCASATDCELIAEGVPTSSSGPGPIDVARLLEVAPPQSVPAS
jgi:hypothetical protein